MHDLLHTHSHHAPRTNRTLARRLGIILTVLWALSGVYFVRADEEAVIRRFGRALRPAAPPGVHAGLPWPLDRVTKVRVRETRRTAVGFRLPDQSLGRAPDAAETQFFTGDRNIVEIQLMVQYMVQDPVAFLFRTADIDGLVRLAAETALTAAVARSAVDAVLTTGRSLLQQTVFNDAQLSLNAWNAGVQIVSVDLQQAAPPAEVADAFRDVISARGDRDRIINEAQGYRNNNIPRSRGEAERMRVGADAYQHERINRAAGEADRFLQLYQAYSTAKDVTAQRLYFEAMEAILPRLKIYIVDENKQVDIGIIRRAP